MSDVDVTEVKWLWKPYIPIGKITIIQGDTREGKTTMILAIASAMTTGAKTSDYVVDRAKEKQISQRTLKTAKRNLEVKSIKQLEDAVRILEENIKSLLDEKMISEKEFIKIKTGLEIKYKIKRGLSIS